MTICRVATQPSDVIPLPRTDPDASSILSGGFIPAVDRSNVRALVEVENQDLKLAGFAPLLLGVEVLDEIGKIPVAKITIADPDGKYLNGPLWLEGRKVQVSLGYASTGLTPRGRFVVTTPQFEFGDGRKIVLICYGEEIKLTTTERRRSFQNLTDSEIVRQIAVENGFTPNIQATTQTFPLVLQANLTDAQFILERAKLYGYEFYVTNGELHFHEPRAETTGVVLQYGGKGSTLGHFKVGAAPGFRAVTTVVTQVDPLSGEPFSVSSQDKPDEITLEGLNAADGPTRDWKKLAAPVGGGTKFVSGGGHLAQRGARLPELEGLSRASRWIVEAHGESVAIEALSARRTVKILGVGRWSGDYRITRVVHRFHPGYRVDFSLSRTWTGDAGSVLSPVDSGPSESTKANGLTDVSSQLPLAGIAIEKP